MKITKTTTMAILIITILLANYYSCGYSLTNKSLFISDGITLSDVVFILDAVEKCYKRLSLRRCSNQDSAYYLVPCQLVCSDLQRILGNTYNVKIIEGSIDTGYHNFLILKKGEEYWLVDPTWQQYVTQLDRDPERKVLILKISNGEKYFNEYLFYCLQSELKMNYLSGYPALHIRYTIESYFVKHEGIELPGVNGSGFCSECFQGMPYTKYEKNTGRRFPSFYANRPGSLLSEYTGYCGGFHKGRLYIQSITFSSKYFPPRLIIESL